MTKYILPLMIGHILGDYYFQTEKIAEEKEKSYRGIVIHSLVYILIMIVMMALAFNKYFVCIGVIAAIVHFVIDSLKYVMIKKRVIKDGWYTFSIDQFLHVLTIAGLGFVCFKYSFDMNTTLFAKIMSTCSLDPIESLKVCTIILMIHKPANVIIQKFLKEYKPITGKDKNSILATKNAGRTIGTIERVVMIILIYLQQYSALGLVLTAKSITRYNKIVEDKEFAEYYLLGTLFSVVIVLVLSLLFL
ncbi:DUF3307 domain-containing protein [Butyrivibrio sp. AC2005]|uniref:DUF3307 domain-containing protein n=1 Tax=Butyrivibrio sp. AC2005 TaxID=1280672 RepID=UPI00042A4949|nr:DUF3307 domain-containing protein [Butyrivibrio sp. AC2005]